ncbi:unnamed protein product, partial [Clonostachys rosea f. rosea IK726]
TNRRKISPQDLRQKLIPFIIEQVPGFRLQC